MLNELANEIHDNATEKGFWDVRLSFAELIMLVVTELAEAVEADREDFWWDGGNPLNHNTETFGRLIKNSCQDEISDAMIRLLDICGAYGIDIDSHIRAKMNYNSQRERLHGKRY